MSPKIAVLCILCVSTMINFILPLLTDNKIKIAVGQIINFLIFLGSLIFILSMYHK